MHNRLSFIRTTFVVLLLATTLNASGNGYRYGSMPQSRNKYPLSCNMLGLFGGVFITSNPEVNSYYSEKSYTDYGGGLVYDYRYEFSENSAYEIISSCMLGSCKTAHSEEGFSKTKVTLPLEGRFYLGFSQLKLYLGAGLQYNFIWSIADAEDNGYYYGSHPYSQEPQGGDSTGAHQLSGNGSVGLCILGLQSVVHFLVGTKFHFPIINNAESTETLNGSKVDFTKDKTSIAATAGVSFDLGKKCVLMFNYDYPLGNNTQTSVENNGNRSFFEQHSQSITMNLMYRF